MPGLKRASNSGRCYRVPRILCSQEIQMRHMFLKSAVAACLTAAVAFSASIPGGTTGKVQIKSAGALAFGNEGVLFIGDSIGGSVVAVDTRDTKSSTKAPSIDI